MIEDALKILGGPAEVRGDVPQELFAWPYVNEEIENAVLDVAGKNKMCGTDTTERLKKAFVAW